MHRILYLHVNCGWRLGEDVLIILENKSLSGSILKWFNMKIFRKQIVRDMSLIVIIALISYHV